MSEVVHRLAKQVIRQWDNHDVHRVTEADKALWHPEVGEPTEVAIARKLVEANAEMSIIYRHWDRMISELSSLCESSNRPDVK